MSGDKRNRLKQWLESGEATLHPLTFPQRELWETSSIPVGDIANHICCLIHVRGLLTVGDCEKAFQRVVERQQALRISFLPGKNGPVQMLRATGEASFEFREISAPNGQPEAVEELAQQIFSQPFDLVQGPLYRAVMLRRATDDHVVAFVIHHSIADGWTLGVFVQDLFGAYVHGVMGETGPLPAVPLTYTAWAAAERAFWTPAELATRAAFWQPALAGAQRPWNPPAIVLPLSRTVTYISAELCAAVRDLSRKSGATLFSTLLAGFKIALAQHTGKDDVVIGSPVANRGKQASRELMGYCSGVVPLRRALDRSSSFLESVQGVHQMTVDSFASAMPFVELVRAVGDAPAPGYNPVYSVRFALQNHPIPDVSLPTLSAKLRMASTGTGRFDLGCEITEQNDVLEVAWVFRKSLCAEPEIENLDRMFQTALTRACRSPESRVAALMT